MRNFSWGKKKDPEKMISFEFIHTIRYSTETTKQLASEGSGQTLLTARNGLPEAALQNLRSLPALIVILYSYHPSHYRQSTLFPPALTFGFTFTNHPGQKSLSRWHEERWNAQSCCFSRCPSHSQSLIVHFLSPQGPSLWPFFPCPVSHILPQKPTVTF